jgi:hypothetical protein
MQSTSAVVGIRRESWWSPEEEGRKGPKPMPLDAVLRALMSLGAPEQDQPTRLKLVGMTYPVHHDEREDSYRHFRMAL